jgi:hypothetical protein
MSKTNMDHIARLIAEMTNLAIDGATKDCFVYGTGYIKFSNTDQGVTVEHIPFNDMEQELEGIKEIKKWTI